MPREHYLGNFEPCIISSLYRWEMFIYIAANIIILICRSILGGEQTTLLLFQFPAGGQFCVVQRRIRILPEATALSYALRLLNLICVLYISEFRVRINEELQYPSIQLIDYYFFFQVSNRNKSTSVDIDQHVICNAFPLLPSLFSFSFMHQFCSSETSKQKIKLTGPGNEKLLFIYFTIKVSPHQPNRPTNSNFSHNLSRLLRSNDQRTQCPCQVCSAIITNISPRNSV